MTAQEFFDGTATALAAHGAVIGPVFGTRALRLRDHYFLCLDGDALTFRLHRRTGDHLLTLALTGARLWKPAGHDRPLQDWILVPAENSPHWTRLTQIALAAAH